MNDASFTPRVIESGVRLSQSILWRILTEYYSDRALDAWKDNTVPYHITSNPSIAHAYAQLIFAFQQDLATHDQAPPQPLPIVELGRGPARSPSTFCGNSKICGRGPLRPSHPTSM
ncbi:MAG: hypothetical protein R2873_10095 [Caldilineaceae bacterium]